MTRARTALERIRQTFWVLPAIGILLGAVLGLALPAIDDSLRLPDAISFGGDAETATSLLQVIVTIAVSVAGISFSVIVVALVLAAQQLSPRVLGSFQRNPLNQAVLAFLLGTAIYATCVLSSLNDDPADPVPEFSISLAILLAASSLALFVVFLHHLLRSLNASAVIRRIAAEGHQSIEEPYPVAAGQDAPDEPAAEENFDERARGLAREDVRAPRAGYLATVEATKLLDVAAQAGALVEQRVAIGEFVVTGAVLASVWAPRESSSSLKDDVYEAFILNEERVVDHDVAFPIRQLADVALKGLSPSVNDPTTSENAMDSLTDTLVRVSLRDRGTTLRLDSQMVPRLRTTRPSFDELVRLGFDQVRRDAARRPSFCVRLLELLAALRDLGGSAAKDSQEISRQAALIAEHSTELAEVDADRLMIEETYSALHQPSFASN